MRTFGVNADTSVMLIMREAVNRAGSIDRVSDYLSEASFTPETLEKTPEPARLPSRSLEDSRVTYTENVLTCLVTAGSFLMSVEILGG